MNKIILATALMLISVAGKVHAQWITTDDVYENLPKQSATEKTFSLSSERAGSNVFIRDFVTLKNGKMVLELNNVADFDKLRKLDGILKQFNKDIAFYKDSLENNNAGNVRIDYVIHENRPSKEIRFKKYSANGDLFVNKNGETARLKTEQDTVRIIIHMPDVIKESTKTKKNGHLKYPVYKSYHNIYVTLYVDDYSDVSKIIDEKILIDKAIDTLVASQSLATKLHPERANSSAVYRPGKTDTGNYVLFKNRHGLMAYENDMRGTASGKFTTLTINGTVGAGLVMNTIAPSADIALMIVDDWRKDAHKHSAISYGGVIFSPYFFFDRDAANNLHVHNNWFVNAEIGHNRWPSEKESTGMGISSVGVGYLFSQSGNYFHGPTFKIYTNVKVGKITICPELIGTNNLKQIFPGVTFKF